MKWLKAISFLLIATAVCASVWFVDALKPTSAAGFAFFTVWLVLPYAAIGAALVFLHRKGSAALGPWYAAAGSVSVGGIAFLADVVFWHPDSQGALAVLMVPVLQGVALALLLPLFGWAQQRVRT